MSFTFEIIKMRLVVFLESEHFHLLVNLESDHMYGANGCSRVSSHRQKWTGRPRQPQGRFCQVRYLVQAIGDWAQVTWLRYVRG